MLSNMLLYFCAMDRSHSIVEPSMKPSDGPSRQYPGLTILLSSEES